MELSVRVNAPHPIDDSGFADGLPRHIPANRPVKTDLGPCLYLGPAGQRCYEKAFEGGYCAKHQPGAAAPIVGSSKVVAASAGIIGLLWPYLADLVREIIRLIHSQ